MKYHVLLFPNLSHIGSYPTYIPWGYYGRESNDKNKLKLATKYRYEKLQLVALSFLFFVNFEN